MKCPFCGSDDTQVVDTRANLEANTVRRRRKCVTCEKRFTTYERVDLKMPRLVKKDGSRTDCHMFLVDLRPKGITGKDAETALGRAHITVNKNAIPNDPEKPAVTSGVRLGSPAMTTRGFGRPEAQKLAHLIADVLERPNDERHLARVADEVKALCARFPVYA